MSQLSHFWTTSDDEHHVDEVDDDPFANASDTPIDKCHTPPRWNFVECDFQGITITNYDKRLINESF